MGPAFLPTPLVTGVWALERTLDAWLCWSCWNKFRPLLYRPALAPVPDGFSGRLIAGRIQPISPLHRCRFRGRSLIRFLCWIPMREAFRRPTATDRFSGLADIAGVNSPGNFVSCPEAMPDFSARSFPSDIASMQVPLLSSISRSRATGCLGKSAFPLSMFGECASLPSRARGKLAYLSTPTQIASGHEWISPLLGAIT